jgi:hypothetical protein
MEQLRTTEPALGKWAMHYYITSMYSAGLSSHVDSTTVQQFKNVNLRTTKTNALILWGKLGMSHFRDVSFHPYTVYFVASLFC